MSVIIIVVTVLAVAVPLVTLSVVLLVFVLVQVFSSWTAAGRAETSEATATLSAMAGRSISSVLT